MPINIARVNIKSEEKAAQFILDLIPKIITFSSTNASLSEHGYPQDGPIETTIRTYRASYKNPLESALSALETGCGNCQEMAYASAIILRCCGYTQELSIGQFGLNHQFLFIGNTIVDPWSNFTCQYADWKTHLRAYGGAIKDNIMYGRLLAPDHFELEDEEPEKIYTVPSLAFLKQPEIIFIDPYSSDDEEHPSYLRRFGS